MAIQPQAQRTRATPKQAFMPIPANVLQRKCACGGTPGPSGECDACRKKRLGMLQRSATLTAPASVPPIVGDVLNSPGQPLDPATRNFMEPRFGHDFSQVRVHTNAQAARSAQSVNALAYTVGRHIAFDEGQYRPDTQPGRRLVAHELVHVMQQSAHGQAAGHEIRIAGDDAAEREAARMEAAVENGAKGAHGESRPGPALQRQPQVLARRIDIRKHDQCLLHGNCLPPQPATSPIPGCSPLDHETSMLIMAREYVRTQIGRSLSTNVRSIDCFFGIGSCAIEFDSGVAVRASLLLNPFVPQGIGSGHVVVEEIVSSSVSLKDAAYKRLGPRCAYDVGCPQQGQLSWTLTKCFPQPEPPPGPGDFPLPSGNERVA